MKKKKKRENGRKQKNGPSGGKPGLPGGDPVLSLSDQLQRETSFFFVFCILNDSLFMFVFVQVFAFVICRSDAPFCSRRTGDKFDKSDKDPFLALSLYLSVLLSTTPSTRWRLKEQRPR